MPTLEHELRRYGDVLDDAAGTTRAPSELVTAARPRRALRTALVAVAVVVVVSLIAVFSSARSTHEPTPATTPIVAPTTTTNPQVAAAVAAARRAAAEAWIEAHGGDVIDVNSAVDIAMSESAIYVWGSVDAGDRAELSRVDRQTRRVTSVAVPAGPQILSIGGNSVYLVTTRNAGDGMQVERLDPQSLATMWTTPIADPRAIDSASQVAAGPDFVWVSSGHDIEQFDAQTGRMLRTVNLTLPTSRASVYLSLDPTGKALYIAYGDGSGTPQPLQLDDPQTGEPFPLAPVGNPTAAGGFAAPQIAATDTGAWVATQGSASPGQTVAHFYRKSDLKPTARLTVGGDTGRGLGLTLAVAGTTLWDWNGRFIACADARTGAPLNSSATGNVDADALVADTTTVAVVVDGTLGVFPTSAFCAGAQ